MTPNSDPHLKRTGDSPAVDRAPLTEDQIRYLNCIATPLVSSSPDNHLRDFEKEAIDSIVGKSQIVALGEVTHGSREIFEMKHRIIRFLIEERGVKLFAIEASTAAAEVVNDYILNGKGDASQAIAGMDFAIWHVREILDLVEWMRSYNMAGKDGGERPNSEKVSFHGFDMPWIKHPIDRMVLLIDQLERERRGDYRRLRERLSSLPNDAELDSLYMDRSTLDGESQVTASLERRTTLKRVTNEAMQVVEEMRELVAADRILGQPPSRASHYLRLIEQHLRRFAFDTYSGSLNHRDRCMADNVSALLQEHPGQRLVLWAHNSHLQRINPSQNQASPHEVFVSMGQHLAAEQVDDYCVLALTFFSGEHGGYDLKERTWTIGKCIEPKKGAFEYDLESFRLLQGYEGPLCLNFRIAGTETFPWPSSIRMNWQGGQIEDSYDNVFGLAEPTKQYNGCIFIPRTSSSRRLPTTIDGDNG